MVLRIMVIVMVIATKSKMIKMIVMMIIGITMTRQRTALHIDMESFYIQAFCYIFLKFRV